jgi:hypothetical protein
LQHHAAAKLKQASPAGGDITASVANWTESKLDEIWKIA